MPSRALCSGRGGEGEQGERRRTQRDIGSAQEDSSGAREAESTTDWAAAAEAAARVVEGSDAVAQAEARVARLEEALAAAGDADVGALAALADAHFMAGRLHAARALYGRADAALAAQEPTGALDGAKRSLARACIAHDEAAAVEAMEAPHDPPAAWRQALVGYARAASLLLQCDAALHTLHATASPLPRPPRTPHAQESEGENEGESEGQCDTRDGECDTRGGECNSVRGEENAAEREGEAEGVVERMHARVAAVRVKAVAGIAAMEEALGRTQAAEAAHLQLAALMDEAAWQQLRHDDGLFGSWLNPLLPPGHGAQVARDAPLPHSQALLGHTLLQALALREAVLGAEHPGMARPLAAAAWALGLLGITDGRHEALLRRRLAIVRRVQGPHSAAAARATAALGRLCFARGDAEEAMRLLATATRHTAAALGEQHLHVGLLAYDSAVVSMAAGDLRLAYRTLVFARNVVARVSRSPPLPCLADIDAVVKNVRDRMPPQ